MNDIAIRLTVVAFLVFAINLPFGYFRSKVRKFSFKWFLFIHLPIPLVVFLRIYSDIGFAFYTYPILVGAFFLGQFVGKKHMPAVLKNKQNNV
jgi:hypothetical protein